MPEVLVMGTSKMRAEIYIPNITVNGVKVPILNEPVGNLGAYLSEHEYVCTCIKSYQGCKLPP